MTSPARWEPDDQLVAAVLAHSRSHTMADLTPADRSWVVAGLTRHGLTAEDIAERLSCSERLVHRLRAEAMTQVCLHMQQETDHFRNELRLARSEHRAALADLAVAHADIARLRAHRNRLIAAKAKQCPNGHDMTPYNTYERNGRHWCRECHRLRQAAYRLRASVRDELG